MPGMCRKITFNKLKFFRIERRGLNSYLDPDFHLFFKSYFYIL